MNDTPLTRWIGSPLSLSAALARLALAMAPAAVLLAAIGFGQHGVNGVQAGLVAAAACIAGAALTLVATSVASGPQRALYALAASMVFGFAAPFGVGFLLDRRAGALAQGGVFGLCVLGFEYALLVQTYLVLRLLQAAASAGGARAAEGN